MGRPMGSKNKGTEKASAAILPEDMEFDRELERMAKDSRHDLPPDVSDREPVRTVTHVQDRPELLSAVDATVSPAHTDDELKTQIHLAKEHGCDSIEATLAICKRFCRDKTLEDVGYFMFHDVKVYIEGHIQRVKARDFQTIEQRVFGKA